MVLVLQMFLITSLIEQARKLLRLCDLHLEKPPFLIRWLVDQARSIFNLFVLFRHNSSHWTEQLAGSFNTLQSTTIIYKNKTIKTLSFPKIQHRYPFDWVLFQGLAVERRQHPREQLEHNQLFQPCRYYLGLRSIRVAEWNIYLESKCMQNV